MATRSTLERSAGRASIALVSATVGLLLGVLATAHAEPGDPEALRRDLITFAESLGQLPTGQSVGTALRDRLLNADDEAMREIADTLERQPDWPATRKTLLSLGTSPKAGAGARAPVVTPGSPAPVCDLYPPLPTGVSVGLILGRVAFESAAAVTHAACDIDVAGFNAAPACVASGVLDVLIAGVVAYLDLTSLCEDELASLASDAAIDTQAGMATQLDTIESKLDSSAGAAQQTLERQLERQVRDCAPLVSLTLPREFGGALEDVRDLVDKWLHKAQLAAVGDIPEATQRLQSGNVALASNEYRTAYRSYCLAYRALLPH